MILLDSNILIEHLSGRIDITLRVRQAGSSFCFVSAVVAYELLHGALRSVKPQEYDRVQALLNGFVKLPFDESCAVATAKLRLALESPGQRIEPHDLMIAGSALAYELTLVTHNVAEFSRVEDLRIEDCQAF